MELKNNLTNKFGLPRTFYNAVARDEHEGADYSMSQMTKPVQMVVLENRHGEKVVEDVTDRIWALFGSAAHRILQEGEDGSHLVEQYFKETVGGVELSGIPDLMEDLIVWDYKVTSVWSWIFRADKMDDFASQVNGYAWFYRKAGFDIKAVKICMILRDWMKSGAMRDPAQYPQNQVQIIDIPLWSQEKTQEYLEHRIALYEQYKGIPDGDLPPCSTKDRWAKPPKFAVMKKGVKKAAKVEDSRLAAEKWAQWALANGRKGPFYLEERPGDLWKRCEYCRVRPFCPQYKAGHKS